MAKKATGSVKVQIAAGKATPAPPVGPALGQAQVNIMEFCKQFNARTSQKELEGLIVPVVITVYSDRTFTFITKTPPASVLLKRAAGIAKGSGAPNKDKVGKVTLKQVEDIAKQKMPDLNAASADAAIRTVRGTARSETEGKRKKSGKNIEKARKAVEPRPYTLQEAVPLLQKVKFAKFDETVEVTLRLGVDPKHADQ